MPPNPALVDRDLTVMNPEQLIGAIKYTTAQADRLEQKLENVRLRRARAMRRLREKDDRRYGVASWVKLAEYTGMTEGWARLTVRELDKAEGNTLPTDT